MFNKEKRYTMIHYLFGALPARLGDEMSGQAILLMGFALAQTAALGSTVLAALTLSAAIGGPLLGAVLDRSPRPGKILAYALGLYAIGISCVAMSLGHMPIWVSIAIALAAGSLMPAISGGWSSRLKSFVADEQMTKASAIDAITFNIAGLAGPAVAGLTAAMFGAHWAIVGLAILLVAALPMAWSLPRKTIQKPSAHTTTFMQDVMAGFKIIGHNKKLFRITLMSVISYMGIGMLWVIYPLVGQELFGNPGYGGLFASLVSVGALVATVVYAKWPTKYSPDSVAFMTTLILSGAMLTLAFLGNITSAIIVMLFIGLADGPQLAAIFAVRHREAPERSRGQVFTTGASLKITAAAVGAALAGQLAGASLQATILVACFVQLAAAGAFAILTRR
jgi:MFS family permease